MKTKDTKVLKNCPWINEDGTRKSDEEIRQLGQSWTAKTWNDFLDDDVGTLDDERLVFFPDMGTKFVLEKHKASGITETHEYYDNINIGLLLAMDELSQKEKVVLKWAFWKEMKDKDLAKLMGTTHANIRVLKHRALKKLKQILPSKRFRAKLNKLKKRGILEAVISSKKQWVEDDCL